VRAPGSDGWIALIRSSNYVLTIGPLVSNGIWAFRLTPHRSFFCAGSSKYTCGLETGVPWDSSHLEGRVIIRQRTGTGMQSQHRCGRCGWDLTQPGRTAAPSSGRFAAADGRRRLRARDDDEKALQSNNSNDDVGEGSSMRQPPAYEKSKV
jgi:hypothetical protein